MLREFWRPEQCGERRFLAEEKTRENVAEKM